MAGPAGPLPVWIVVRRTFEDVYDNRRGFLATAGLWILLLWATSVVLFWSGGWAGAAAGFLGAVLVLVAHPAVSVAWHRHVILDDGLPSPMAPLTGPVGRYLLWAVLISLLAALPAVVAGLVLSLVLGAGLPTDLLEGRAGSALGTVVSLVLLLIGLLVWVRLVLVLPTVAVDRPPSLREASRRMAGSVVRFIAGGILILIPIAVATLAIGVLVAAIGVGAAEAGLAPGPGLAAMLAFALVELLDQGLQFIGTVLYTAYLSFAYLWLSDDLPVVDEAPPA